MDERSKAILQTYMGESAWDDMLEFMSMSEVERALLSVQMHLVDAANADFSSGERGQALNSAWNELADVMHDLAKERKNGK